MISTKANAVSGPTPGCVCNRRASGHFSTSRSIACVSFAIVGFYDPTSGSVTLDGIDLRDLAQSELRRHVVMVTQENFMFGGTVADNIRFGRPDATADEIRAAATAV